MDIKSKLAAFAAFVLALSFPAAALEYNDGKITWTYVPVEGSTNEVCLGDGTNACIPASVEGAITLPDMIGGKRVTVVAANAFKGCTKVTGVSILGNLEWIEEGAFDGATSLKTFGTLNRNENFFSYQGSLYAGDWEGAELVRVPPALEAEEFSGLVKPQVWSAYPDAFKGCAAIQKIKVGYGSANALAECSFAECSSFAEFVWVDEVWYDDKCCVKDGALYYGDIERDGYCQLIKWPTAKPVTEFESVKVNEFAEFSVYEGAFSGNSMENITLPNRVSIDANAFVGCPNLKTVTFLGHPDQQFGVLDCAEEVGLNLQKVIYPGFPLDMAEDWESEIELFKEAYPESKIVFARAADPNVGKTNLTIPYTERWDLCWKYDFEAYAKDLTTLTFEGPCPDEFWDILEICSNVTKVVYSANPIYRDSDYDWESWKSVMSWDWADEFPGRTIVFQEGTISSENQFYFEDPECRDYLCGIWYYDEQLDQDVCLSPIWPARGELKIPNGVYELGEGALCGLDQVTKLVLPPSIAVDGSINENVGFETMAKLAEIEIADVYYSAYYCMDGCLYYDEQLIRVPSAFAADEFVIHDWDYPYWNALTGCKNIKKLTVSNPDVLECVLRELDLAGCDRLVEFACKGTKSDPLSDYGYAIVDGAIYEDEGDGELCLLLWPNAKRPIEFAKGTVEVYCEAFRYMKDPGAITELTVPSGCWLDLWCIAEEYGFTGITKLVFEGEADIDSGIVEVMPNLKEIVYSPSPSYAENWEWIKEDFAGTGVKFTANEPTEPIWNIEDGELYGEYDPDDGWRVPCVWPDLVGEAKVPGNVWHIGENAFACMSNLTALTILASVEYIDETAFVGCTSLKKLAFNGACPEGLWEVLEVTPSIKEVVYNGIPWAGDCGCSWSEFIAEFKAEHPDSQVVFTPLEIPEEPIWNVDSEGWLCGDYEPEEGIRIPCVWPDLVGEVTVPNGVYGIGENAFACMSNLTALTFPRRFGSFDAGSYRGGYYDTNIWEWVATGEVDIVYSPFVGCTSLAKLTFDGYCPEGLWDVLELTPSIREVYYNDSPWYGECGWIWRDFIAEFKAEHPEVNVAFIALPPPEEPIWNIEYGELYGEYDPEDGWRVPCVWPDLVGEATVPGNVYYIGENAFACMSNLTALTIPASVEEIADAVFVGCTSLKKLVFQGGYVPSGVWELLEFTPGIEEVVVPSWACRQNSQWEDWEFNEWLERFVMDYKAEHPDSTIVFKTDDGTVIDGYIPWTVDGDTMTVDWWACIEENAFDGMDLSGVTKLVLPPYLDYVEDGVFGALKNLREVEVIFTAYDDEVTYFGSMCGEGQRLKLTVKPEIWWECDCEACESDETCPICKTDDEWGDCNESCGCPGHWVIEEFAVSPEQFEGAEWIEKLVIEEPCFAVADYAFAGCANLKEAVIPASVEWMGESVFADCENLEKVYFDGNAPYGCLWLYEEASSNLVSYVKFGTTGWTGLDGDVGMPADGLWPVWDEDDPGARRVEYGKATVKYLLDGELLSSKEVAVGEPFALIPDSEKTGYTFDGWYDEAGEKVADGAEFIIDDFFGSLTFSGALSANTYTVKFDANGGTAVEPGKATFDAAFGELPKTARTGYTFAGWLDADGKQVTAETTMTTAADVTLTAQWMANGYAVKFDANGGTGTMADQKFFYDQPQALTANAFERKTFEFLGWAKTADGAVEFNDAVTVNNLFSENGASMTLYAVWERSGVAPGETKTVVDEETGKTKEIIVLPEDEPEFAGDAAAVYDGFVKSDAGAIVGTVQVKAAKANKKSGISKLTATMQLVGEKKLSFKGGEWGPDSEYAEMTLKDGRTLTIAIGEYGLVGTFGDYEISGSANIFSSKKANDREVASDIMAKFKALTVVYYEGDAMGTVTLAVGSKGKVTASIQTPSGASAKVTAQMLVGDGVCCIPVVSTAKKAPLAFAVWIDLETLDCTVDGPDSWDGYEAGKAGGNLEEGVVFRVADPEAVADLLGDDTFAEFLPEESVVLVNGKKLVVADGAKPGKIVWDKKEEDIDWDKSKIDGYNVSGLKLSYTAKTGAFKGSFKAFALVKGKVKAFTFKVTGVILNGCGYGTATYKKSVIPVEIDL